MPSKAASYLALPYFRLELPAWGRLYRAVVGRAGEPCWNDAPTRTARGKYHGYRMRLDLSDWSDRSAYFLGRYYDLDSQQLYKLLIRPGDHVLDVGANVGMMMLLAARLVGPRGRVDCVEPNPSCVDRLREHVALNNLTHVHVHQAGLADRQAEMTLRVLTGHAGMGSLADVRPADAHLVTETIQVPVLRGDDLVERLPAPPDLIKIDVEGFEHRALLGLRRTLESRRPALMLEFVESHLARAGSSRQQVADLLAELGYQGFASAARRQGLHYRLALTPLDAASLHSTAYTDTLWLHQTDPRHERIKPRLTSA